MPTPLFGTKNEIRVSKSICGSIWTAVLVAACLFPSLVFSQTNSTWHSSTDDWSNAADWTPKKVPNNSEGNTYGVTIDSGGTDVAV
jgi:hypothetical protein